MGLISADEWDYIPLLDTGLKMSVHKTFRRRAECVLNVLCTLIYVQQPGRFELYSGSWIFSFSKCENSQLSVDDIWLYKRY